LTESVVKSVKYPTDDEEHGMVTVAWRGYAAKVKYFTCTFTYPVVWMTDGASLKTLQPALSIFLCLLTLIMVSLSLRPL
jgi:hypothetical protein